jgi:hypothetical protein
MLKAYSSIKDWCQCFGNIWGLEAIQLGLY